MLKSWSNLASKPWQATHFRVSYTTNWPDLSSEKKFNLFNFILKAYIYGRASKYEYAIRGYCLPNLLVKIKCKLLLLLVGIVFHLNLISSSTFIQFLTKFWPQLNGSAYKTPLRLFDLSILRCIRLTWEYTCSQNLLFSLVNTGPGFIVMISSSNESLKTSEGFHSNSIPS